MSKDIYRFFLNWSDDESPVEESLNDGKREMSDWDYLDMVLEDYRRKKLEREYDYYTRPFTGYGRNHPATGAAESID